MITEEGSGTRPPHVHAHAANGNVALGDARTRRERGDVVGGALRLMDRADPPGGLFQRGPHPGVEGRQGMGDRLVRHPGSGQINPVEAGRVFADGRRAPAAYVLTYWFYLRHHCRHVKPGPGQHPGQLFPVQSGSGPPAEIDPGEHAPSLGSRPARLRTRPYREQSLAAGR